MKTKTILLLSGLLSASMAFGQSEDDDIVRVVPPNVDAPSVPASVAEPEEAVVVAGNTEPVLTKPGAEPGLPPGPPEIVEPVGQPAEAGVGAPGDAANKVAQPGAQPVAGEDAPAADNPIAEEDGGFLIKDASINDIFQLLAKRAGKQYFHNNKLGGDEFKVTGHLNGDTAPLKQMEELAFQYGLQMYVKGETVYAMMDEQLQKLPAKEWTYTLRYLRPTDIEQIKALIQPMLTAGRGIVNFEPKTNTIVVIDTMQHIEMVRNLLMKVDQPKGQIVIEVKILRVNNGVGNRVGLDWSSSLGSRGVTIDIVRSLNSVFGLGGEFSGTALAGGGTQDVPVDSSNIILTPFQVSGVLKALKDNNLVTQKSNPVVITEDNERAVISLIDRVPIITSTVNNSGNGTTTTTDEVRYKIDEEDSTEPGKTREIGVTISMTPSLLPDGTVRMNMRPRNAQIVENITGPSGNVYPRVSEATVESIARIPDGNSLIVGGFYGQIETKTNNKVPLLGNIPVLNFFFKSKDTKKERSSLVFVVTPTSYNPACVSSHRKTSSRIHAGVSAAQEQLSLDEAGGASRLDRAIRGSKTPYLPQR